MYIYIYIYVYIHTYIHTHIHTYIHTHTYAYSRLSFCDASFTTIHFYKPCPVGPTTPDLWCITVATQVSFLYVVHFQRFTGVRVFLLFFYFSAVLKWTVIFPPMPSIKKTEKKKKSKQLTSHSFLMSSEPRPGLSSATLI